MQALLLSTIRLALLPLLAGLTAAWDLQLCKSRESHWVYGGHKYVYSGQSELLAAETPRAVVTGAGQANLTAVARSWSKAGDWCQQRCMDLVSIETEAEWTVVRERMERAGAQFIWTSGHICDKAVGQRCFTDPTLQPRLVNGWFWSGSGERLPPTDRVAAGWRGNPWGTTGLFTRLAQETNPAAAPTPQPDNAEQRKSLLRGEEESCLALATGLWQQETVWNDIACYHEKEWICEDSDILLKQAGLIA